MATHIEIEHRAYVRALKAQIAPRALARARVQVLDRERVKVAKKTGKMVATIGGLGLGTALLIGLARIGRSPILAKK